MQPRNSKDKTAKSDKWSTKWLLLKTKQSILSQKVSLVRIKIHSARARKVHNLVGLASLAHFFWFVKPVVTRSVGDTIVNPSPNVRQVIIPNHYHFSRGSPRCSTAFP